MKAKAGLNCKSTEKAAEKAAGKVSSNNWTQQALLQVNLMHLNTKEIMSPNAAQ